MAYNPSQPGIPYASTIRNTGCIVYDYPVGTPYDEIVVINNSNSVQEVIIKTATGSVVVYRINFLSVATIISNSYTDTLLTTTYPTFIQVVNYGTLWTTTQKIVLINEGSLDSLGSPDKGYFVPIERLL